MKNAQGSSEGSIMWPGVVKYHVYFLDAHLFSVSINNRFTSAFHSLVFNRLSDASFLIEVKMTFPRHDYNVRDARASGSQQEADI